MSTERWFTCADEVLAKIRATQTDAIRRAGQLIAEAAAAGGGLHIYDTGHCSHEPIHRAGGLLMMRPFRYGLSLETTAAPKRAQKVAKRLAQARVDDEEQTAMVAVGRSALTAGDVLIVNSVSGKAIAPVQVAMSAKYAGLSVIAITNVSYSKAVKSEHASGKKLFQVADVVIDNCGVAGDAALEMEGLDARAIPTSGLTFCYIIWALTAEAISQMLARGLNPHVYRSVNLPDGEDFNTRAEAEYRETGV